MDLIGNTFKELFAQKHAESVRNASALAKECAKDGMRLSEVEEMLYANGFDQDVVDDTLTQIKEGK